MGAKVGGGGGGKFALGQNADINVTPFVDVLLVLLIIFMLAIPLATVSVKLDLPPPSPDQPKITHPPVLISVEQYGRIYIGTKEVTLASLAGEIQNTMQVPDSRTESVTIRANRYVQYQQFMSVLNQLQYDGYSKVNLMTENIPT